MFYHLFLNYFHLRSGTRRSSEVKLHKPNSVLLRGVQFDLYHPGSLDGIQKKIPTIW